MSAISDQRSDLPALRAGARRRVQPLPVPEFDHESIFSDEARLRFDPGAELERLRPLLIEYDPRSEPVEYYNPPRNYGVLIAKFVGYSLLGAITIGIGLMIIAPFIELGGC